MFVCTDVTVGRDDTVLFKSFSLPRLDPGELLILKGSNGRGKSTLLQGIMGIGGAEITGKVELDGSNLLSLSIQ